MVTGRIDTGGFSKVEDLLGGEVRRSDDVVEFCVEGLDVRVLILGK